MANSKFPDGGEEEEAGAEEIPPAERTLEKALLERKSVDDVRELMKTAVQPYTEKHQWERVYSIQKRVHDFIDVHFDIHPLFQYIKHDIALTRQSQKKFAEAATWER